MIGHLSKPRRGSHLAAVACFGLGVITGSAAQSTGQLDPSAWGSDHVGKALPEFITSDECLFCHRAKIGPAWPENHHQSTVRAIDPEIVTLLKNSNIHAPFADAVEYVLGRTNQLRLLKRSAAYGRLDMLSTQVHPGKKGVSAFTEDSSPRWDHDTFANRCEGCHTTAVDSRNKTFSAISVGCFSCHGDVDIEHTKDTARMLLAEKRKDPARVVTSICGSCHIRNGHSRSTGLPFPNNFVPGDNLFRDFGVDFSDAALAKLNPVDRHIVQNVREVVVQGKQERTCLSCHSVHGRSSSRHHKQKFTAICGNCHDGDVEKLLPNWSQSNNPTCGY